MKIRCRSQPSDPYNSETFSYAASYPFTVGIEGKDFTEDSTGLEYIGTSRQQMGDGGLIVQIKDTSSGAIVSVTDATWKALVVSEAPTNPEECEAAPDPETVCESRTTATPDGWSTPGYDDNAWPEATVFSTQDVSPKDGYDTIDWDTTARFIWGPSLTQDNTVLFRADVKAE